MKNSRKLPYCPNCGQDLSFGENFCPNCGQENKDQKVSLLTFINDFLSNYLSFDSSFFRTLLPFFFVPGKLTRTFNQGKRKKYLHPIRLYLMASLFYFFLIGLIIPVNIVDDALNNQLDLDSSLVKVSIDTTYSEEHLLQIPTDGSESTIDWNELKLVALDKNVTDEEFKEFYQSSNVRILGISSSAIKKKRAFIANSGSYIQRAIKSLPLMMLLLLPLMAGLLKLLYTRHKGFFYIEHLVHAIHLHAIAYTLFGLGIIFLLLFSYNSSLPLEITVALTSIYALLSMWMVYRQNFFKTLLKFLILYGAYFILWGIAVMLELYISLWVL